MDNNAVITLGGKEYPIAEFTLGDQEILQPLFVAMAQDTLQGSQARTTMIWIALKSADPTNFATIAQVRALKGVKQPELMEAVKSICKASGLDWAEKPKTGEAKPVTEPAPQESLSQDGTGPTAAQS